MRLAAAIIFTLVATPVLAVELDVEKIERMMAVVSGGGDFPRDTAPPGFESDTASVNGRFARHYREGISSEDRQFSPSAYQGRQESQPPSDTLTPGPWGER